MVSVFRHALDLNCEQTYDLPIVGAEPCYSRPEVQAHAKGRGPVCRPKCRPSEMESVRVEHNVPKSRWSALVLCVLGVTAWAMPAHAQQDNSAVSRTDQYGNAVSQFNMRRQVGSFQNSVQRSALRGFQDTGRRRYRRGGLTPFSLRADRSRASFASNVYARRAVDTRLGFSIPNPLAGLAGTPLVAQRAFNQYGGFERRRGSGTPGDLTTILARQHTMTQANALNAPLYRALWSTGTGGAQRPRSVAALEVPFERVDVPDASAGAKPLDQSLNLRVTDAYTKLRVEGWARFGAGEYRRAVRAFEAGVSMSPHDYESRLGELFSHVSLGAMRTSAILVATWARRDSNPLLHATDMTARYASVEEARALRLRTLQFAEANPEAPSAQALYVLVLWCLGDEDEAAASAAVLGRNHPNSAFADWPLKLREASAVRGGATPGAEE